MWGPLVVILFCVTFSVIGQIERLPYYGLSLSNTQLERDVGHSLQVLKILNGTRQRYLLDTPNLSSLLMREDVVNHPVVMVSIAGPFRGGKSFLLDFFLRYFNASRSQQQNGQWMGDENEPLQGFHWRGGSNRDTTGIHMWSQPFHVKLEPSGEEVVVLLMDTQGTYDSRSSLRDSTIIFATSTLLSSVQIYNLFANIDETDLQHLQLFTDYGQKASAGGKAFQELMFLIRDWPNSYEYDYGYSGGQQFLSQVLKVEPGQISELRNVREHINNSFEKVTCFLMPHPGMKVARKTFRGSLADIGKEFKTSLLEMIPSLFDPRRMTPKMIGGQRVTGRDLMTYFHQYVQVFNSDKLPDITTILEGTKMAAILAATNTAHHEYSVRMKVLDDQNQSFTSATIRAKHNAARDAAVQIFNDRIMLGEKEATDKAIDQLKNDLDQFLGSYQYNNDIKLRSGLKAAKDKYNETLCSMLGVQYKQVVCVNRLDLEQFHQNALTLALTKFDSLRMLEPNEIDDERIKLQQEIAVDFSILLILNTNNNLKAVQEAHTLYLTSMRAHHGYEDLAQLLVRHNNASKAALDRFASMRNRATKRAEDPYKKDLQQKIAADYEEFEKENINPNKILLNKAQQAYNDYVRAQWHPEDAYYHPQALDSLHEIAKGRAIEEFQRSSISDEQDIYMDKLTIALQKRYMALTVTNDYNNNQAVEAALQQYITTMDSFRAPTNVVQDFFKNFRFSAKHKAEKSAAISSFRQKRRGRNDYSHDKYMIRLENRIAEAYRTYVTFWTTFADKVNTFLEQNAFTIFRMVAMSLLGHVLPH